MNKYIALFASLFLISTAQADDVSTASHTKVANVGALLGYGTVSDGGISGFTWGVTAGTKMSDNWGWDVYFSRTQEEVGTTDVAVMPIVADLNFYISAPIQFYVGPRAGVVISSVEGFDSQTDFAAGAQIGTDFWLADSFTVGVNVNWNHTFSDGPDGNIWNFVAPIKFWF